ncbi:MAG: MFS transporter [Candidatus Promineifilaceae bacterium]
MPNSRALTAASFLSMLFLGIASTLIGAAARNINLSPFQIGLFLTIQNVGFMVAVWVSGALADTHKKPRILMVGSLILAASFFTFYLTGLFWLNLIIMLLIGLGIGTYEGVTDAMLLDLHQMRQSLYINVNHFFVTFGSMLITLYLIFLEMNWRISLTQSAVVVLALAIFYGLSRSPSSKRHPEDYLQRVRILSRERLVVALFIATILAVGVELGTTGILTTYLMDLRDFTQTTSKVALIVFLGGIATGRLVVGFVSHREQIPQLLLGLFGFAFVFFSTLYLIDLGQLSYIAIFLAGLSMSALLPLMITLAGIAYPAMAGTVIGSIKVAIPIGGILVPFLMSLLSRAASLQVALLVFPAAMLLAFIVLYVAFRRMPALDSSTA